MEKISVLVADDNEFFRQQAVRFLKTQEGVGDVRHVPDGTSVIPAIERSKPDLILLDLAMPGMTGLDLLPLIQDIADAPRIVLVSGLKEEAYRKEVLSLGAYEVVPKDRFLEDIPGVIEACVRECLTG